MFCVPDRESWEKVNSLLPPSPTVSLYIYSRKNIVEFLKKFVFCVWKYGVLIFHCENVGNCPSFPYTWFRSASRGQISLTEVIMEICSNGLVRAICKERLVTAGKHLIKRVMQICLCFNVLDNNNDPWLSSSFYVFCFTSW